MENPKCPYCGEEQYLTIKDHREIGRMEYYMCIHCGSRSPVKTTIEEAYAAAMKRDRAKGEWIDGGWEGDKAFQIDGRGNCWHVSKCSVCGFKKKGAKSDFCPNCGADMRKEANDE